MADTSELAGSLGMKTAMSRLDALMAEKGVSAETRSAIINASEMMYEYIPYAIEQKKSPTDAKVLAKFLANKGMKTAKFFGNDGLNCAVALVDFILSVKKAGASTGTGAPPLITLAYGLALLDLIEVGNSCEFAQQAYYEAFIRDSSVKLAPVKVQVRQYYSEDKRQCVMPDI